VLSFIAGERRPCRRNVCVGNITARTDVRDGVLDGAENGNGDEILLRRVMDVGGDGSAPRVEVMGDIPFKIIDLIKAAARER